MARRFSAGLPATDCEYLESLGYNRDRVRDALSTTRGDRRSALHILQKGGGSGGKEAAAWRGELKDDFMSGAATTNLPVSTESRALWRTPLYIRVGEPRTRNGKTFYTLSVVKKTAETWKIERSYSEFLSLKNSFPLFTTSSFKNAFPPKKDLVALFSSVNVEQRRRALEEWMRELCLNEECMRNDIVLGLLGEFVEEARKQPPQTPIGTIATLPSTPAGGMMRYGGTAPHAGGSLGSPTSTPLSSLASLQTLGAGPLSLEQFRLALPCKIAIVDPGAAPMPLPPQDFLEGERRADSLRYYSLDPSAPSIGPGMGGGGGGEEEGSMFREVQPAGLDHHSLAMRQLQKDYSRDRIILQGHHSEGPQRLEGSSHELAKIVAAMQQAVSRLLEKHGKPPLPATIPTGFFFSILGAMSRTESAFLAHANLSRVLCDGQESAAGGNGLLCVVPESSLADPIKVSFRLKEREVGGDWCIVSESEAATVFRVNDVETEDLSTLLQVKTTYHRSVFGMPRLGGTQGSEVLEFVEKAGGKPVLVLEREMRSTARDWGGGGGGGRGGNPF